MEGVAKRKTHPGPGFPKAMAYDPATRLVFANFCSSLNGYFLPALPTLLSQHTTEKEMWCYSLFRPGVPSLLDICAAIVCNQSRTDTSIVTLPEEHQKQPRQPPSLLSKAIFPPSPPPQTHFGGKSKRK